MLFKNKFNAIFLLIVCFQALLCSNLYSQPGKDFFILTVPKSGTHLFIKLIHMLNNKQNDFFHNEFPELYAYNFCDDINGGCTQSAKFEQSVLNLKAQNKYALTHFNLSGYFENFVPNHPEYTKFIMVRDLRDVCVSCTYMFSDTIEELIGSSNFDDKLMYVITLEKSPLETPIHCIKKNAEKAVLWHKMPGVVTVSYEKLVGANGGGSNKLQIAEIAKVTRALKLRYSPDKIKDIASNLFGVKNGPSLPSTFREGKIGSWKKHFNKAHIAAFNTHLGKYHTKLGYSLNN